ncbi:MAG TPA: glycosyltransferase family 39 protein [Solirubrobacteraceae bacterium]|nr:glycosyltransferase family 39 protein [Solirubrobacteraceae bacterium]
MATLTEARLRRWTLPPLPERMAARWSSWLLAIAGLGFGLPLLIGAVTGNLAIPHNDAWSYSRITRELWLTGHWTLLGWNRTTLIGQSVMIGPLGRWVAAQQTAVAVLGLMVLYCVYELMSGSLDTRKALLGTALVAIWPGWANLTTSFMTDVPALAGMFGALAVGRAALQRDSRRLFALSLMIGLWGVSVREQALAAPAAVVVYGLLTPSARERLRTKTLLVGAGIFLAAVIALIAWRGSVPDGDHPHVALSLHHMAKLLWHYGPSSYFTLGAALSPAALLTVRPQRWRAGSWLAAGLTVVLAAVVYHEHAGFTVGNYFIQTGSYHGVLPGEQTIVPNAVWHLIELLATVGAAAMSGSLVQRWRNVDPVLGLFTVLTAVATLLVGIAGQLIYDRYWLAVAPGVLAILLSRAGDAGQRRSTRWGRISAGIAAALATLIIAAVSAALAANSFAFDAARWHAGTRIAAAGVPAARIDAGLEWLGWYSAHGKVSNRDPNWDLYGSAGWFSTTKKPCVVLRPQPLLPPAKLGHGWTLVHTFSYRKYLVFGSAQLSAYATHQPGCPAIASEARIS